MKKLVEFIYESDKNELVFFFFFNRNNDELVDCKVDVYLQKES